MLHLLTGDIQTGKTRWLQQLFDELAPHGMRAYGVIAPGVWREHRNSQAEAGMGKAENVTYEKLGIDNVLLPEEQRIAFARRVDLVGSDEWEGACRQARSAGLAWAIRDEAIAEVNAHFTRLLDAVEAKETSKRPAGLIVIDEIGRLELLRNQGLTAAVELIERGATPTFPHALVVVREQLLECAIGLFSQAPWNGLSVIRPNDKGKTELLNSLIRR